jgi:hypothetical protein
VVDPGGVPGDHTVGLEPSHPAQAWRRRQPDPGGQLLVGQPPVLLQQRHDCAIKVIYA